MVAVRDHLDRLDVALLYLMLCLGAGVAAGSGPAAVAALLAFLGFNYFFIPPYHTFAVDQERQALTLFAFLAAALVTGQLVARVQERSAAALREQRRTSLLYDLNAALVRDVDLAAVLDAIVERVVSVYGAGASRILLPEADGGLRVAARFPISAPPEIDRETDLAARAAMAQRRPTGPEAPLRSRHGERPHALYLPIATAERVIGVLEVSGAGENARFGDEDERILATFADQAALALERVRLREEGARAAALARSDELKSALLAAVSHDLRTPLATIKASVTSLLDRDVVWTDATRSEFLQAIDEETDRLSLLVDNLLDLSKIEGGVLRPERAWYDVAELVADVIARLEGIAAHHRLTTEVAADLPLACFDYVQIRQVLLNLAENAIKYTSPGTAITVAARALPDALELSVVDDGPGIPAADLPRVFDKFYRGEPAGRVPGSGLGLAISRGLVEANGGRIRVESGAGTGTVVRFTLPLAPCPGPGS